MPLKASEMSVDAIMPMMDPDKSCCENQLAAIEAWKAAHGDDMLHFVISDLAHHHVIYFIYAVE